MQQEARKREECGFGGNEENDAVYRVGIRGLHIC